MVRELIGLWGAAAERCVHDSLLTVAAVTAAALFTAVSLGFATFAGYEYCRAWDGHVAAALIVAAIYALLAIAILAIEAARRRAARLRRAAAAASPPAVDSLLQSQATPDAPPEQLALIAAMRLGRELSTMQLLALTLAAGFMAGRKLRERYKGAGPNPSE
jgi:hypothetical protein